MRNQDVLYSPTFELYIQDFLKLVKRETSLTELAPVMEQLRTSDLLSYIMTDPMSDDAKACVQNLINTNHNIPRDFFTKFLAIVNMKVKLAPTNLGLMYQSYNAKVLVNNIEPTKDLINLTIESRQEALLNDANTSIVFNKKTHTPAQTLRLQINDDLLPKCINAMADLNRVIVEGNRANGFITKGFVDTQVRNSN